MSKGINRDDERRNTLAINAWRRLRRNKMAMFGLTIIILLVLSAIFADLLAPYGFDDQDLERRFIFPCLAHPLGTDELGRDLLSRVIYGARISLLVGLVSVAFSATIGGTLGAVAGFFGGRTDNIIMRLVDIMMAIPGIMLAIIIAAVMGQGLVNVIIAVGISSIPGYARIMRASTMSVKGRDFVESARAVNASNTRIILRHILPNVMAPLIVQMTLGVAGAILATSGLSFIGMGIQPPSPEWGAILSSGRQYLRDYWYIVMFPGLAIMLTIFAINLFGDGLRDALDPKMKR